MSAVQVLNRAAMAGVLTALLAALSLYHSASKVPHLPKPITNCPECRDATLATVKE